MDWILSLDMNVMRLINVQWTHSWLDTFLLVMASFHLWKWPLLLTAIAVLIWGGFKGRVFLMLMLLCVIIGDTLIVQTFKATADRTRPHESHNDLRRVRFEGWTVTVEPSSIRRAEHGNSMPSAHAANNFALALVASLMFRPWGRLLWIWAFLMAYSRVYTADHYPSDVLVSFFVAVIYAGSIVYIACRLWQKWGSKWLPNIYERHPRLIA
ncbi:MAG: phosphatase PAP2 family protein [Verrucomicrobiota bacterium]